jgi:cytochrome b561
MTEPTHYSPLQRTLHWITVLCLLILVPLGFYMVRRYFATNFDALTKDLFNIHKLLGLLLLAVVALRLGVRLVRGAPPHVPPLPAGQRMAAEAVHWLLYALLLIVPVLGWMGASAYGLLTLPFGLRLPEIVANNGDYAGQVLQWHLRGAVVLCLLAGAHIGAALLHRLVLKDRVLERMWPARRR